MKKKFLMPLNHRHSQKKGVNQTKTVLKQEKNNTATINFSGPRRKTQRKTRKGT